jgi:uncharacterized ion transporter superfamily protein YfcC
MSQNNTNKESKKKGLNRIPHVYVILLVIVAICSILTYIVPSGQYDKMTAANGREVINPDSFHFIDNTPVGLLDYFKAVPDGLVAVGSIIFFIFIVGGAFAVINSTGAIEAGIGSITKKMQGKERAIIPVIVLIFSLGGAVFGMAEETLPFIPIMVTLAIALGFDSLTGVAMVLAGAGAGFAGAFMNPFTIGVAQGIAELPLFSGMLFRIVGYVVMVSLVSIFIFRYAGKIRKNPELSMMYEFDKTRVDKLDLDKLESLTPRRKAVLVILGITILLLVFGVVNYGWYIQELAALFLAMGILSAIVGGLSANKFAEEYVIGMSNIAGGAMVVGFARAILIVLEQGHILDTILFSSSNVLLNLPSSITAIGMYIFQCLLNFIIPSGSGQAAVSMPILAPLSDLVGVTRQTAVIAYQYGDGISNIFTPTSGYFMAGLALAKVPWDKWAKWILPLIIIEYIFGGIFVLIAQTIGLGPF